MVPVSGAPADASADDAAESARRQHEMAVNRALQLSNLREFGQSARLFAEARQLASNDPIQTRLSRNFEAIDALNRGELDEGLAILARPMPPLATALESGDRQVRIDPATARGLKYVCTSRAEFVERLAHAARALCMPLRGASQPD